MREARKAHRAAVTDEQRQKRVDYAREYRADFPERYQAHMRNFWRKPHNREKGKQAALVYRKKHPGLDYGQHEQLRIRRANTLAKHVFHSPLKAKTYTWKTHNPVSYDDQVDHHCTACDKICFLKYWWQEKPHSEATETDSDHARYMCSLCFASNWDLVVPETYSGKLPRIFVSPGYPPPFLKERLKAKTSAQKVKEEHGEDQKEERS